MAIPNEAWRTCYVGYFDILGISEALRLWPGRAVATVGKLQQQVRDALDTAVTDGTRRAVPRRTRALTFSDALLLFTMQEGDDDIQSLLSTVIVLFCHSFGYSIPLRGGVTLGVMCIDDQGGVYTGPALLEAHHLSESAQWIGVSCDDAVARHAEAVGMKTPDGAPIVVPARIPRREEVGTGFALNWPALLSREIEERPLTAEGLHRFFRLGSTSFKRLQPNARRKYENAATFFNNINAPDSERTTV